MRPTTPGLATAALLLMTCATGVVDAVSYLALDQVFTGNMTGNVLFLGFAALGVDGIPFLNNAVALAGFVAGAVLGGRLVPRGVPAVLPLATLWTLVVGIAGAVGLCAWWLAVGDLPHGAVLVVTAALAALMGAQTVVVKPIGNTDVTTVVVTSALANLARDSRLAGAPRGAGAAWRDRLLAVVAMGAGAALGAALVRLGGGALALAGGLVVLASAVVVLVVVRRRQRAAQVAPV